MTGLEDIAEGLVIRQGDVLVLRATERLSAQQHDELRAIVREQLPDGVKCLIVDGSFEIAKVEA